VKIEISPDEARLVLKHRVWGRLFKTKGWKSELGYFSVMAPPVVVVFSVAFLFTFNVSNVVPSVFLAFGLMFLPLTFKALKKFKVLQNQIQAEMVAEENQNRKGVS
jgi:hypothetical protein